uniref:Arrestin C-terminal-like domain-containing protein n=1 Tax=Clytia hemisphaerica TaxID=252671 RepID=A0A7M5XMH0_9CNID
MMADPKISIELSNEKQEIFYPGEKISGHVVIELDKPLETKNVCLTFGALIPGRSCFCPGENIPIEMMIENNSSKLVTEATIKLIQTAIYREHHEHHKDGPITVRDYTIAKSKVLFKDSTYLRYIGEGLTAPENTSPTNWRLKIIKVRYHVEVRIDLSWTTNEPCIEIPIIIGTVPLGIKSKDINQNNWF